MQFEKFTVKSQEAIQAAQNLAQEVIRVMVIRICFSGPRKKSGANPAIRPG